MKRLNYKKMKWHEAKKLIDTSHGMSKAKWDKLWKISRDKRRR
jgi:hypothetical protein